VCNYIIIVSSVTQLTVIKCYRDVVRKVNGILVPGGGCAFNMSSGLGQSTNEIFQIAKLVNNIICNKIKEKNID